MNVQYKPQGDYLIPCIRTKEQKEIHLGAWANRHRQNLKQSHKSKRVKIYVLSLVFHTRYFNLLRTENMLRNSQVTD